MTWGRTVQRVQITIFNLAFYAFTVVMAVSIATCTHFASANRIRRMIAWWAARTKDLVKLILRGNIEYRGRENLPPPPYILAPKHQSELDIVVIFGTHWDASAVAMKELADLPFIGPLLRKMELIIVSVEGGPQGKTATTRAGARAAAERNQSILIYPEGELMSLGAKQRYKAGVWHIYDETGLPVVPVAQSLGAIWPRREWSKKPFHTGAIKYLPPIAPGLDKDTFLANLETVVETETMALIREHAHGEELAAAEDRYARGAAND